MNKNIATLPKKGLNTGQYSLDMNKDVHIVTLPKEGLKSRPYNIGMEKKGLKKSDYNINTEKKDLKKLTEGQLIKLLLTLNRPGGGGAESAHRLVLPSAVLKR